MHCCALAGHYVSFVKSHDNWLFFDDEQVEAIPESMVHAAFGSPSEQSGGMDHGYILMYNREDPQQGPQPAPLATQITLKQNRAPGVQ